jgi:MFS family permease
MANGNTLLLYFKCRVFANNVSVLFISRLGLGIFQSGCGAPAYSLIADYFPPERRTFANSIYNLGIYIG